MYGALQGTVGKQYGVYTVSVTMGNLEHGVA